MFEWFKKILGIAPAGTPVQEEAVILPKDEPIAKAQKPKKSTAQKPKKAAKPAKVEVDLEAMKKDELLAHAKKVGAKANASMKKADVIAAIKAAA